jgi:hypothetical protein
MPKHPTPGFSMTQHSNRVPDATPGVGEPAGFRVERDTDVPGGGHAPVGGGERGTARRSAKAGLVGVVAAGLVSAPAEAAEILPERDLYVSSDYYVGTSPATTTSA